MKRVGGRPTKRLELLMLVAALGICLAAVSLHWSSHEKMRSIYVGQMEQTVMRVKMNFLEDTVTNMVRQVDQLRLTRQREQTLRLAGYQQEVQRGVGLPEAEFLDAFMATFSDTGCSGQVAAVIWNTATGDVLFHSPLLDPDEIALLQTDPARHSPAFSITEVDGLRAVYGIDQARVDASIKEEVGDLIRGRVYSHDAYIWVNEVLNYTGGDDYAIRRFHPNLRDTEGMYLSTSMQDVAGNQPYLEELEGIREDGELFFTYFFQRMDSTEIAEKLTYAQLYAPYDWIIAMGVHLEDIAAYSRETDDAVERLTSGWMIQWAFYIFAAVFLGLIGSYMVQRRSFSKSVRVLEKETNMDELTRTFNRRYGERVLAAAFERYHLTKDNPAVMMLDIDDFKVINDEYGHAVGDTALQNLVEHIRRVTRSSDYFIRWGGDEFVGIFPDLEEQDLLRFGEKVVETGAKMDIEAGGKVLHVTVSVGFSYFQDSDTHFDEVLQRADAAMYRSKKEGKNRANLVL